MGSLGKKKHQQRKTMITATDQKRRKGTPRRGGSTGGASRPMFEPSKATSGSPLRILSRDIACKRGRAKDDQSGQLRPIGVIRSKIKKRREAPKQGSEGAPDAWL